MDPEEVHRRWTNRSAAYSPSYYAYRGPGERSDLVREHLDDAVGPDAAVLEVGCSCGRHLAHLHEHGYRDLYGIDINDESLEVMADAYPALADAGTFYVDAVEDVVPGFDDGRFDAVYSVETLQHIPPDSEWVFGELARVAADVLATVENEGDHRDPGAPDVSYVDGDVPLYYRNFRDIFTRFDLAEEHTESVGRDTFRVFRTRRQ